MPELCLCLDELDFIILDDHAVSVVEAANGDAMRLFIGATGVLKAVKPCKKAAVMRQHLHICQAKGGQIGEAVGAEDEYGRIACLEYERLFLPDKEGNPLQRQRIP